MFTGIIQEVGRIKKINKKAGLWQIVIESFKVSKEVNLGDSVAVNGVCLTVVDKKGDLIFFDVVKNTLDTTNLKRLKIGSYVNLEPSLKVGDKLGGHFVLGHIDSELKIKNINSTAHYRLLSIVFPLMFKRHLVDKGSIALEGISLTVQKVFTNYFTVSIIPHTLRATNLRYKKVGDWLNAEFDYLLKSKISGS
ncbi:MAG: riboflavin synthase [Candidatus Omnitrophica bacterium]|nr:riboflavin synthase [Candidatus Omnitrophota bacterium]MCM8826520.1 riboflavin synthase [Candidatus Omnitrophota bacterium]